MRFSCFLSKSTKKFSTQNQEKTKGRNYASFLDKNAHVQLHLQSVWIEGEGGGVEQNRVDLVQNQLIFSLHYSTPLHFPSFSPPSKQTIRFRPHYSSSLLFFLFSFNLLGRLCPVLIFFFLSFFLFFSFAFFCVFFYYYFCLDVVFFLDENFIF